MQKDMHHALLTSNHYILNEADNLNSHLLLRYLAGTPSILLLAMICLFGPIGPASMHLSLFLHPF